MKLFLGFLTLVLVQFHSAAQITHPPGATLKERTEREKQIRDFKAAYLDAKPIRAVTNQVFNVQNSALWQVKTGRVESKAAEDVFIFSVVGGDALRFFAVKNYPGDATVGKKISLLAMRTGTVQWDSMPLELWDYGTATNLNRVSAAKFSTNASTNPPPAKP